ncbi:MAG: hypothetical protein GEV04_15210 [Actinophytocola sp.]|nr:hypothetical protein [Actinophytocola sp.]
MSENTHEHVDHLPPAPKLRRRWPWILALPVLFFVGLAIGLGDSGESAAAKPEVSPETVTQTVTEEIEVEAATMPKSCKDALDGAAEYIAGLEKLVKIKVELGTELIDGNFTAIDGITERQDRQIVKNDKAVMRYAANTVLCEREVGN